MCGDQNSSHDNNSLNDADICNSVSVVNERFQHAFGALLLHSEGDCYMIILDVCYAAVGCLFQELPL